MERILHYARRQDYTRYTSTLAEAWRASIQGLTESVRKATEAFDAPPEFEPDKRYMEDPVSAFGVLEARRHRTRGITLAMFLGLFKYYRQAYLDCLDELPDARHDLPLLRRYIRRVFDLVEISYCQEWASVEGGEQLAELHLVLSPHAHAARTHRGKGRAEAQGHLRGHIGDQSTQDPANFGLQPLIRCPGDQRSGVAQDQHRGGVCILVQERGAQGAA